MNYKTVSKPLSQVNYSEMKKKKRDQCYTLYAELPEVENSKVCEIENHYVHLKPPTEFSRSQETYLTNFDLAFKCIIQH